MRTMNLKLEEIVGEVYKNLSPKISSEIDMLNGEIIKSKMETTKLDVQIEDCVKEVENLKEQIDKYIKRLDQLRDLIEG